MATNDILLIITSILGSGGVTAVITALLSARKYKAEAESIEQQAEEARRKNEQEFINIINEKLIDIGNLYKNDAEESRKYNEKLTRQVENLSKEVIRLRQWIVEDNGRYICWLENEVLKHNPDATFPPRKDPPVFNDIDD